MGGLATLRDQCCKTSSLRNVRMPIGPVMVVQSAERLLTGQGSNPTISNFYEEHLFQVNC